MATVTFTANGQNRKQVNTYVVVSPAAGSSVFSIVINGKTFEYTAQTAVAATEAAGIVAAIQAQSDIKEMLDFLASQSSANVVLTAQEAGKPFTISSTGATGGATFNGSITTANLSSADLSDADNWSAAISNNDALVIDLPNVNIQYGLTGITNTGLTLTVRATFNGELGLPIINTNGYPEYRGCYCSLKATSFVVGLGAGPGPQRCYLNGDAAASMDVTVYKTGSSQDDYPACMIKHTSGGGNLFGTVRVVDGSVGIALIPSEVATVTNLLIGGDGTSPTVRAGNGASITTVKIESGTLELTSTPSGTTTVTGGATVIIGNGGTASAINVDNGTVYFGGNGTASTLTDLTVGEAGVINFSTGTGNVTITNGIVIYQGAQIIDPLGRLVTGTVFKPQNGVMADYNYKGPPGKTWTMS